LYNSLQSSFDFRNGDGFIDSFESIHELSAFYGSFSFQSLNLFDARAHLRYESSSRLGPDNRWGTFFGIWAGKDINRFLQIDGVDESFLHVSYGITGQVPPLSGMASLTFQEGDEIVFADRFSPSLFVPVSPNPKLRWEQRKEIETGLRFKLFNESVTASVTYFRSKTDGLILLNWVPSLPNIAGRQWQNIAALSGRGFESLNGLLAFPGAPGLGNTQLNLIMEGEKVGSIWGPRFAGFDSEGLWQFSTPEGKIVSNFEVNPDDYVVIGNGLPDFTVSWNHRISYSNWDLDIFLQGEFGHDMINLNRLYYENPNYLRTGNVMSSTPGTRLRAAPFFSDYYVEDASYLRLHTFSIGYRIESLSSEISHLRIYITGNNLITLTGFDGIDPSVRLSSNPPTDNGSMISGPRNYTAPGIERRNIWPTQTTLTAGIELAF
jgi:iron complex outermembrane receptor protein